MILGDLEILPVLEATFRLDGGAMFGVIPKPLWERRTRADERNRIPMAVRPLVVRAGGVRLLIDAGIGSKMTARETEIYAIDRTQSLDHSLSALGLSAADIDVVLATHLHFDHAGGFTHLVDGVAHPSFPRARYAIRLGEYEDATHPHERNRASYFAWNYVPLVEAGLVDFHDEDVEILPGVRVCRTGGHTRHHQIVRFESGGRVAVFAADLLPTTAHIDEPWIMGYDLYPVDTLMYKKAFVAEAIRHEYVIFFEHDPVVAAGIIRQDGTRRWVEPVDAGGPALS